HDVERDVRAADGRQAYAGTLSRSGLPVPARPRAKGIDPSTLRRQGDFALLSRVRTGDATLLFAVLKKYACTVFVTALFSNLVTARVAAKERFDHLQRYCDSGIAIPSLARNKNDAEIVRLSALADLSLMISSNVTGGHRQAMLARGVL